MIIVVVISIYEIANEPEKKKFGTPAGFKLMASTLARQRSTN